MFTLIFYIKRAQNDAIESEKSMRLVRNTRFLVNKDFHFSVFPSHKAIIWLYMDYFFGAFLSFALNVRKKQHEHSSKCLILCSTEEKKLFMGLKQFKGFEKYLTNNWQLSFFCFSISTFSPHSKRGPTLISVQDLCNFLDVKLRKNRQ